MQHSGRADSPPEIALSDRETQILQCLMQGLSNKLIARKLDIAETTVKVHVKGLLRKLRAANRTQAAIWAVNSGMASLEQGASEQDADAAEAAPAHVVQS